MREIVVFLKKKKTNKQKTERYPTKVGQKLEGTEKQVNPRNGTMHATEGPLSSYNK